MTIVEFLNARLVEDEQSAQWALSATATPARLASEILAKRRVIEGYNAAYRECTRALEEAARVAGRRRGAEHAAQPPVTDGPLSALWAWREALKHIAAVYRDHPDYDSAWRA
ncbi:hypothetical protein CLV63_102153 [Murinocardiopsis flavida]|uniref:Uncharacterized protein n=1 Tax=Murinocardiopsis flavida TaxID=645275 RepID=A0A2P8DS38_9ACTN|nr:DUF6221 family protein [Murinocardiopsis flavida]PSL00027.1 hypothetical protein CLV63_102153 [Murinocardiopsis flavida]